MKKILGIGFLLSVAIGNLALADEKLCVGFKNFAPFAVEVAGSSDPGYNYTVQPNEQITLSRDHLMFCSSNDGPACSMGIYPLEGNSGSLYINYLRLGTLVVYAGPNQYYVNKNARIKCEY